MIVFLNIGIVIKNHYLLLENGLGAVDYPKYKKDGEIEIYRIKRRGIRLRIIRLRHGKVCCLLSWLNRRVRTVATVVWVGEISRLEKSLLLDLLKNYSFFSFAADRLCITKINIIIHKAETTKERIRFPFVKPITRYPMRQQAATVNEYTICVETWTKWSTPAPALERMVVSDIGEQWSPNTLPASVAAREATSKSGQMACATGIMIGIKIPNVPPGCSSRKT